MIRRQKKREHWRILKWFGLIEKILWVTHHSYLLSELSKCFAWYIFCQVPRSLVYCLCLVSYPIWLTNQPTNWFEESKNIMQVDREARLEVLNKLEAENRALAVRIFLFKRLMLCSDWRIISWLFQMQAQANMARCHATITACSEYHNRPSEDHLRCDLSTTPINHRSSC